MSRFLPSQGCPAAGHSSSTMRLLLLAEGDPNGNAFPASSSSSSSSSSSCRGESSPDSFRSLSSLSGGRIDSPMDVDMLEVTVITPTTASTTRTDKTPNVVISKWLSEGEEEGESKIPMMSESNDNSLSDASVDYTWNNNSILLPAVSMTLGGGGGPGNGGGVKGEDLSIEILGGPPGSFAVSEATETRGDDDESFLSVSSDMALGLSPTTQNPTQTVSTPSPTTQTPLPAPLSDLCDGLDGQGNPFSTSGELQREGSRAASVPNTEAPELQLVSRTEPGVDDGGNEASRNPDLIQREKAASRPGSVVVVEENVTGNVTATLPVSRNVRGARQSTVPESKEEIEKKTRGKPADVNPPAVARATRGARLDPKKPDLKNVKSKVMSRPSPAAPRTTNQMVGKPAQANEKKAPTRKDEVRGQFKGQIKVAVLRPIRGRNAKPKAPTTNQNTLLKVSNQPEKRMEVAVANWTQSSASTSPASEVRRGVKRPARTPGAVWVVPVLNNLIREADRGKEPAMESTTEQSTQLTMESTTEQSTQLTMESTTEQSTQLTMESTTEQSTQLTMESTSEQSTTLTMETTTEQSTLLTMESTFEQSTPLTMESTSEHSILLTMENSTERRKQLSMESTTVKSTQLTMESTTERNTQESMQRVSARQQQGKASGASGSAGPSGTLHAGQGNSGHGPAPISVSTSGKEGLGAGCPTSPTRARQSQRIPKPRPAERLSGLAHPGSLTSHPRPTANQVSVLGSGRPMAGSKLPVKGLPTSLSSSSLGSNTSEWNGSASRAPTPPEAPVPGGCRSEERPSRSLSALGTLSCVKPPACNASPTAISSGSGTPPALAKAVKGRSRTFSLQAKPTGLKMPTGTNQVSAKALAVTYQSTAKQQTQNALQRTESAPLSRTNATAAVDKNKPRGASTRPTNQTTAAPPAPPPALGGEPRQIQGPALPGIGLPALPGPPNSARTSGAGPGAGAAVRTGFWSRSNPKSGAQHGVAAGAKPRPEAVSGGSAVPSTQCQGEQRNQCVSQLRKLLEQGNRRLEGLAVVIQHLFTERDEALKQKKSLSLELSNLRDELVCASQRCERMQQEKEEVRGSLEEALRMVQEQHQEELAQSEERLRAFYQSEWDKVHTAYQEEADRCRSLMEQQVQELRSKQETERMEQELSHAQELETVKRHCESSIQELRKSQQVHMENLDQTLKETEASLNKKIAELSSENQSLSDKLRAEEERRRELAEKSLDSHTLYLQRELESLKVVLDIKTNQLHQQDKKLMHMDKLVDTNVKLEETLIKVQQENEDFRARMDRHAALSKQLCSEQAALQQNLQKESKVNKRLSMENEELLWKLHNGDLASPRRLSPTSPFGSRRNSATFPSATTPLSPR